MAGRPFKLSPRGLYWELRGLYWEPTSFIRIQYTDTLVASGLNTYQSLWLHGALHSDSFGRVSASESS